MELIFKVRVEILILIAIAFFILSSHLLCSCSKVRPMEAFAIINNVKKNVDKKGGIKNVTKKEAFQMAGSILSI